eukprot:Em0001g77a
MFFLPLPLNKTWNTLSEVELGRTDLLVALPDPQLYIIPPPPLLEAVLPPYHQPPAVAAALSPPPAAAELPPPPAAVAAGLPPPPAAVAAGLPPPPPAVAAGLPPPPPAEAAERPPAATTTGTYTSAPTTTSPAAPGRCHHHPHGSHGHNEAAGCIEDDREEVEDKAEQLIT